MWLGVTFFLESILSNIIARETNIDLFYNEIHVLLRRIRAFFLDTFTTNYIYIYIYVDTCMQHECKMKEKYWKHSPE